MTQAKPETDVSVQEKATVDSTRWPINRLCFEDLSEQDTATVDQIFATRDDSALMIKWVTLHKPSNRFRARLVVISALRVWLLKRKKPFRKGLERRQDYALTSVQSLTVLRSRSPSPSSLASNSTATSCTSTVSVILVLARKDVHGCVSEPITLHFDPGVHTESLVRLLQRLLHALRLAFPHKQVPPVTLPSDCHWLEFFPSDDDIAAPGQLNQDQNQCQLGSDSCPSIPRELFVAMTTAYHAFCDDQGVRFRASVPNRLEECATTSDCMDFQYCLGFPPGVDGYERHPTHLPTALQTAYRWVTDVCFSSSHSAAWFQAQEVQALARTLEHSRCFEHIVINDLAVGQASLTTLFRTLLSPFCTISGFTLTNVQLSVRALRILQHVVLQSTIQRASDQQKHVQLRRLDLSFNRFSVAMATELATTLELLPGGLDLLQLERCCLSTASCCRIVKALNTSPVFAASLQELNLAGNHLGRPGTKTLATWISGAFALQRLDLSRSQLDMNTFVHALKQNTLLHESSLLELDLSYNQMRSQASQDLGAILGKTQSLATLFLRGMQRYRRFQRFLPQQETALSALSEAAAVAQVAARRRRGEPVHRADGLRKQFLRHILAPMFANTERSWACMVDVSENDLSGHRAELLAQLLDESPWASRTSLRLDHTRLHDKASLLLLHSIRGCKTLDSLSLEGNGYVKRETQRKRRQLEDEHSEVNKPLPSLIEQAGANALSLLLGGEGTAECDDNQQLAASWMGGSDNGDAFPASASYAVHTKPLRLKELCLKCESTFVFGAHIVTAAVKALARPSAHLQMLDVTGNECGDALAQALGEVLPTNKSLQALFWDGNATTVDGFLAFYNGLLQNRTLAMVQMPIQDTRRILEEQKDPPREKLFSILGKIFKITERNQILARQAKERKSASRSARTNTTASVVSATTTTSCADMSLQHQENSGNNEVQKQSASDLEHELPEDQHDEGSSGHAHAGSIQLTAPRTSELSWKLERCPSPDLSRLSEDDDESSSRTDAVRKSMSFSRASISRYPSTMQSWSMRSDADDFLTQLSRLDSLTASFSASPSHM